MHTTPLKSFLQYMNVTLQRVTDHTYRYFNGLPQLHRSEVTPYLYVGGQYTLQALPKLKKIGITGIVNMRTVTIHKTKDFEGIKLLHLPTNDYTAPSLEHLEKGVAFVTEEINRGGKVYIHCRQGEGRGPTMAIAYLMSTGLTMMDALSLVRKARPFANPLPPQRKQLEKFAELLEHKKTAS